MISNLKCVLNVQNFGLYGERVGALSVVTSSRDETERVLSQVRGLLYFAIAMTRLRSCVNSYSICEYVVLYILLLLGHLVQFFLFSMHQLQL